MNSQQINGIWGFIIQYGLPILLVFSITWLITILMRLKGLANELRSIHQQDRVLQTRLQDAYEKQDALTKQLQVLQPKAYLPLQNAITLTDDITGLPNYQAIMNRINAELSRCVRKQCSCAILFVHLNAFNHIYDTWGQDVGDAILYEASSRLRQNTRTEDFIGHYDRDNFVLLLVEADLTGAIQTAERLRLGISAYPYYRSSKETAQNMTMKITASIGISIYGLHGDTKDALIQQATSAMYQALHDGDNHIRVADINEVASPSLAQQEHSDEQAIHDRGNHIRVADIEEITPPSLTQQEGSDEQATLNALTAAASAHHIETDNHAHRLVILAEDTAREIGCTEQEIRLVRLSALLHDIGKIGIPDAILDKPGPLTAEEWEIMRLHPQIGQRILCQAGGIFATLAHVIVAHHERWDGKGYPLGLYEQNIPIEARILTVVDSFDAMTSRCVYQQPTSMEEARLELLRCAGSQFDPDVVIAFLHVLSRSTLAEVSEASPPQGSEPSSISVL